MTYFSIKIESFLTLNFSLICSAVRDPSDNYYGSASQQNYICEIHFTSPNGRVYITEWNWHTTCDSALRTARSRGMSADSYRQKHSFYVRSRDASGYQRLYTTSCKVNNIVTTHTTESAYYTCPNGAQHFNDFYRYYIPGIFIIFITTRDSI